MASSNDACMCLDLRCSWPTDFSANDNTTVSTTLIQILIISSFYPNVVWLIAYNWLTNNPVITVNWKVKWINLISVLAIMLLSYSIENLYNSFTKV